MTGSLLFERGDQQVVGTRRLGDRDFLTHQPAMPWMDEVAGTTIA
jgi:hypothetical protein